VAAGKSSRSKRKNGNTRFHTEERCEKQGFQKETSQKREGKRIPVSSGNKGKATERVKGLGLLRRPRRRNIQMESDAMEDCQLTRRKSLKKGDDHAQRPSGVKNVQISLLFGRGTDSLGRKRKRRKESNLALLLGIGGMQEVCNNS